MDPGEFLRKYREADAKLAQGKAVPDQDKIILLTGLLLGQETRKERRYGQT